MKPLLVVTVLLAILIVGLTVKLLLIRRSADEIFSAVELRLKEDTNTLIDISSRDPHMKRLANELNRQLKLLRDERRRFRRGDLELKDAVAAVSHDLRTPLTAMLGYIGLMEREENSESTGRYLERVRGRAEALCALTDELMDYCVAVSLRELKPKPTDIGRALEDCLLSFYGAARQRELDVTVEITDKPVVRSVDPDALNRVLSNIISNAVRYSDGDLSVVMDSEGRIAISNEARGLDPLTVGRLFDRFYTVAANRGSTGLGLSIARALTERMGGRVSADWAEGRLTVRLEFDFK